MKFALTYIAVVLGMTVLFTVVPYGLHILNETFNDIQTINPIMVVGFFVIMGSFPITQTILQEEE